MKMINETATTTTATTVYMSINSSSIPTIDDGERPNHSLIHFTIMTIQPILGLLLTLFPIFVIVRHKNLLRRISNKFLVNLFVANCFASLSMIGYVGLALHHINSSEDKVNLQLTKVMLDEEAIFYIVVVTSMIISLINRMAVTLDRALAVKKPFFYAEKFTTKVFLRIVVITLSIAMSYFLALIVCYLKLPLETVMSILQISFIAVILNGFTILTIVNLLIFYEARKQLRAIAQTMSCSNRRKRLVRREYRLVSICLGIVLTFEACWSPVVVWFTYNLIKEKSVNEDFQFLACHLICLNNILDPIIYGWLSKDVKRAAKRLFHKYIKSETTFVTDYLDNSDCSTNRMSRHYSFGASATVV